MLAFYMPLISCLHVFVVIAFLFVLLQFGRLGFCNRDWKIIVPWPFLWGVVVASFFLCYIMFIVS
jgi:hypothetical protein